MRKIALIALLLCALAIPVLAQDATPAASAAGVESTGASASSSSGGGSTDEPAAATDASASPAPADDSSTKAQAATTESAATATTETVPAEAVPTEAGAVPAPAAAPAAAPTEAPAPDSDALLAEIATISAQLEEANATIGSLRSQAQELEDKANDAQSRADAAQAKAAASDAIRETTEAQLKVAEESAARADSLASEAKELKDRMAELQGRISELERSRDELYGKLASFGTLRLDSSSYQELLRSGFAGGQSRLGSWKLTDGVLAQTNKKEFFSRMTFPLVQSTKPLLYSFETVTGANGWVGTGIHLFADGVKRTKGYGEGKSLLIWLTRDEKTRGNSGSYLQVYRSDDDVNMERVLDAKIKESLDSWNKLEVLYDPENEFIVIAVNGSVRAAYRTYFGIGNGATMSLRTLGEGVRFRNLEIRR
jgi:Chromosome segregation ATPases